MAEPLTAADLDAEAPPNGYMRIHAACHPGRPVSASYQDGIMRFECSLDGDLIMLVRVADDRPAGG